MKFKTFWENFTSVVLGSWLYLAIVYLKWITIPLAIVLILLAILVTYLMEKNQKKV